MALDLFWVGFGPIAQDMGRVGSGQVGCKKSRLARPTLRATVYQSLSPDGVVGARHSAEEAGV